ncbi:MAG: RHS repeat-associated core domain-containing protein [Candidatus Sedimenticola sp. 6PFRAG1]
MRMKIRTVFLVSCMLGASISQAANEVRGISYRYTNMGLLEQIDGPRLDVSDITIYSYDEQGNRTAITNALGHTTHITAHDAAGRPLEVVGPNGLMIRLTYDIRGRLINSSKGDQTTDISYDAVGNVTSITQPDGSFVHYSYDNTNRLTGLEDSEGNRISYSLDSMGNRLEVKISDPEGQLVRLQRHTYDALGRLIKDIGGDGQTTQYSYDPNGNRTVETDAKNNRTAHAFDALNRLINSTDALSATSSYSYDGQDNIRAVVDPLGNTTIYEYDGLGNLLKENNPDRGVTTYTHDAAGNVLTRTDARGEVIHYMYDPLNRLISESNSHGNTTSYLYDSAINGISRLAAIEDISGRTEFLYDAYGNVIGKKQGINTDIVNHTLQTLYNYDQYGREVGIVYPSGLEVTYGYNPNGQIDSIDINGSSFVYDITYQPFGAVNGWNWSNGDRHDRIYDLSGQLIEVSVGGDTQFLDYSYDPAGNITEVSDSSSSLLFQYDALNRITDSIGEEGESSWAYDGNGNREAENKNSRLIDHVYQEGSNRLVSLVGDKKISYRHDESGNLIDDGIHLYSYDSSNRLISIDSGKTAQYRHNALGQRVYKTSRIGNLDYIQLAEEAENKAKKHRTMAATYRQQAAEVQEQLDFIYPRWDKKQRAADRARKIIKTLIGEVEVLLQKAKKYDQQMKVRRQKTLVYLSRDELDATLPPPESSTKAWTTWKKYLRAENGSINAKQKIEQKRTELVRRESQLERLQQQADKFSSEVSKSQQEIEKLSILEEEQKQLADEAQADAEKYLGQVGGEEAVSASLFTYDELGQLIGEYDLDGYPRQEIVYMNRTPVAVIKSGDVYNVHSDHLGTPRVVTDGEGKVVWTWPLDPFGTKTVNDDPDNDSVAFEFNLRFPGQYYDVETGLHYNYYRDYDPSTGRYIQSDPIGLDGGLNTYAYVGSNPVKDIDPFGLYYAGTPTGGMFNLPGGIWNEIVPSTSTVREGVFNAVGVGEARKDCEGYTKCTVKCIGKAIGMSLIETGAQRKLQKMAEMAAMKKAAKLLAGYGTYGTVLTGFQSVSCTWRCVKR